MTNILSPAALRAANGEETGEVFLALIKLTHPDWAEDIRFVQDSQSLIHLGEEYQPYGFAINLPDEEAQGVPVMKWAADNVSREITALLRAVKGKISARVVWVLASSPDYIERGPFEVELYGAEYDALQITGTLGLEPVLETQFGHLMMTPGTTPGLF
jgi:uncharacterized protein DUF1833